MSPLEKRLVNSLRRRSAEMSPELAAAILKAFASIRESMTDSAVLAAIASGGIYNLLSEKLLDQAYAPVRARLQQALRDAVRYNAPNLPKGGRVQGKIAVVFDVLNEHHITAIRELDSKILAFLKEDVRGVVRGIIENGLRNGEGPRVTARKIREFVGL